MNFILHWDGASRPLSALTGALIVLGDFCCCCFCCIFRLSESRWSLALAPVAPRGVGVYGCATLWNYPQSEQKDWTSGGSNTGLFASLENSHLELFRCKANTLPLSHTPIELGPLVALGSTRQDQFWSTPYSDIH